MERNSSRKWRRRLGFTLVELIVVIAVLAILAGVGAVAYSGYIDKANEAADLALLGAVNESFQSALVDASVYELPDKADAPLSADKVISAVSYGADQKDLTAQFMKYYAGNETKPFKVYTALGYDPDLGFFGRLSDGTIVLQNGWKIAAEDNGETTTFTVTTDDGRTLTYEINNDALEKYKSSSFSQFMKTSDLMDDVNDVADVFGLFLTGMPQFKKQFQDLMDEFGITDADDPKLLGNALVIGVADTSVSGDFDARAIADSWAKGGSFSLSPGGMTKTAAQIALAYALVTGYANSEYGETTYMKNGMTVKEYFDSQPTTWSSTQGLNSWTAVNSFLTEIRGTDNFKTYYSEQGQADIDGYLGAMGAIHDNRDIIADGEGNNVVHNNAGFSDDDLGQILDAIFGG